MGIQVLYIIAPKNFRDEEYFIPKQILEDAGFDVITASTNTNIATSMFSKQVKIDVDIKNANADDYDAIILAGGSGALIYDNNPDINQLLQEADEYKLLIAAICIAPIILATAGVLDDRDATVWNGDNLQAAKLIKAGAEYIKDENVVIHKNIITANGPQAAKEFAEAIVNNI